MTARTPLIYPNPFLFFVPFNSRPWLSVVWGNSKTARYRPSSIKGNVPVNKGINCARSMRKHWLDGFPLFHLFIRPPDSGGTRLQKKKNTVTVLWWKFYRVERVSDARIACRRDVEGMWCLIFRGEWEMYVAFFGWWNSEKLNKF